MIKFRLFLVLLSIVVLSAANPCFAGDVFGEVVSSSEVTEVNFNGKDILKTGNWQYTDDAHYQGFEKCHIKSSSYSSALENRKRRSLGSRGGTSRVHRTATAPGLLDITPFILKHAKANDVNPYIIRAIIEIESSFNPNAVSCSGACGLMQLKPSTAKEMGVTDYMNPDKNIEAGTKYIKAMLVRFKNLDVALAAYNQGPGTVERAGKKIPNATARHYVNKFHKALSKY